VIQSWSCTIDLDVLRAAPFGYKQGEQIVIQVAAANKFGDSLLSEPTNSSYEAIILQEPDAPINLQNDLQITSDSVIKINWQPGKSDGGSVVLDYTVYYDQGTGKFVSLASSIKNTYYQTSVVLKPNTLYKFKVSARNQVGFSP